MNNRFLVTLHCADCKKTVWISTTGFIAKSVYCPDCARLLCEGKLDAVQSS